MNNFFNKNSILKPPVIEIRFGSGSRGSTYNSTGNSSERPNSEGGRTSLHEAAIPEVLSYNSPDGDLNMILDEASLEPDTSATFSAGGPPTGNVFVLSLAEAITPQEMSLPSRRIFPGLPIDIQFLEVNRTPASGRIRDLANALESAVSERRRTPESVGRNPATGLHFGRMQGPLHHITDNDCESALEDRRSNLLSNDARNIGMVRPDLGRVAPYNRAQYSPPTSGVNCVSTLVPRLPTTFGGRKFKTADRAAAPVTEAEATTSSSSGTNNRIICPICMECAVKGQPTSTKCGHIFCSACIREAIRLTRKCPICKKKLSIRNLMRIYV